MSRSEFEKDRQIDPEGLDVECVRQVDLLMRWAERAVDARAEMERLKFSMDTVWAELDLKVRRKPQRFHLESVTEGAVKATISTHPDYIRAVEKYHAARKDSMWLDRAVDALEMKKRMLEELIKLHGLQYFAGPSAPRDLAREWNSKRGARDKRSHAKQTTILRRRES